MIFVQRASNSETRDSMLNVLSAEHAVSTWLIVREISCWQKMGCSARIVLRLQCKVWGKVWCSYNHSYWSGVMISNLSLWQRTVRLVSCQSMWRTWCLMERKTGITSASAATSATLLLLIRNIMTRLVNCSASTASWPSISLPATIARWRSREKVSNWDILIILSLWSA